MVGLLNTLKDTFVKYGSNHSKDLARKWLLSKVNELKINRSSLLKTPAQLRPNTMVGRMYFYYYDPKTKKDLPFYDRFPLVMPIEFYPDGSWLGINFHYLPPQMRLLLVDKLSEYSNNKKYDSNTTLQLSYKLLQGAKKYQSMKPCLKRYLPQHVQSKFLEIPASEWDIACIIPVEYFMKESKESVWANSRTNM